MYIICQVQNPMSTWSSTAEFTLLLFQSLNPSSVIISIKHLPSLKPYIDTDFSHCEELLNYVVTSTT